MINTTYRIVRFSEDGNLEILSTGIDKDAAELGLIYDGLDPNRVVWRPPIHRPDPRGGMVVIFDGVYDG